jgi:S-DNA-T family DNA segregation ATPase FtsK/SpoIIIE
MGKVLDKFKHDIVGVLWLAAALFIGMALASFHPSDPSFNSVSAGAIKNSSVVANWCGYFGSFLADALYQVLGVAAWLPILGGVMLAIKSFKGSATAWKSSTVILGMLLILVVSSFLGLYFPATKIYQGTISLAGIIGLLVSRGLVAIFNKGGVAVILWTSVIVLSVFFTEKRISELAPWLVSSLQNISELFARLFPFKANGNIPALQNAYVAPAPREINIVDAAAKSLVAEESTPRFSIQNFMGFGKDESPKIKSPPKTEKTKADVKSFSKASRQIENWQLPSYELLSDPPAGGKKVDEREITKNARLVEQKLAEFDVLGQVVEVKPGPAVTMYEFRPAASIKINDITKLADDLSLALSAESLRIIAPIPGRDVVGIETSNSKRDSIFMKELVEARDFWSEDIKLPIALGKSVDGEAKIIDLRKIPHLLVAGTTGSGKSVFTMSLVTSLIMRHSPKTLRMILVDPKQVDLAAFHKIPHLLLPPIKEARTAVSTLKWLIREMEKRYRSMSKFNSKNIEGFNAEVSKLKADEISSHEEKIKLLEGNPQTAMQNYYCKPQPYIVTVIEEFADLMSVDRAGVEPAVVRLAQMARASGIHLVIAMQSPRREVLTGLIKTNFPGRICFKVASKVDSSIVLDQRGAERLLSVGDMLYLAPGFSTPQRYHGAFLRDEEMAAVTDFWTNQGEPQYEISALNSVQNSAEEDAPGSENDLMNPDREEDYDQVVAFVASQKEVSASLLQRRFRFGYPKASRLIEILEHEGVIGPANGSKPRSVLANKLD